EPPLSPMTKLRGGLKWETESTLAPQLMAISRATSLVASATSLKGRSSRSKKSSKRGTVTGTSSKKGLVDVWALATNGSGALALLNKGSSDLIESVVKGMEGILARFIICHLSDFRRSCARTSLLEEAL